jgi:hypothetical protein
MANSAQRRETCADSVDFRPERFASRIVLGRALQETRAFAANCNLRSFGRLVENDSSSFDFFARAICARGNACLKA